MTTVNNKPSMQDLATKDVKTFTKEDAVQLALFVERQEQALKLMKEKLKAFVTLNGAIQTNEKVWNFVPSTKWEFSPEAYEQMATDIVIGGGNPYDYFSLGANGLKKLGWSEEILENYGYKTPGNPTFKAVKLENI